MFPSPPAKQVLHSGLLPRNPPERSPGVKLAEHRSAKPPPPSPFDFFHPFTQEIPT